METCGGIRVTSKLRGLVRTGIYWERIETSARVRDIYFLQVTGSPPRAWAEEISASGADWSHMNSSPLMVRKKSQE